MWNIRDVDRPIDGLYIGRAGKGQSGKWGNPFSLERPLTDSDVQKIGEPLPMWAELDWVRAGVVLTRERSLSLYSAYLAWAVANDRLDIRELVTETEDGLRPKDMIGFCAPQPCHGDQLLQMAESYALYRNEREYNHEKAKESALYIHRGETI